ncbi:MAG: hypothetical protein J6V07_04320, partial [Clostridia bacterium]|nr:hypothetical protein [Clostridia bacterium]
MEKTKLLESILRMADILRREDERNALTANYFAVALADTILALKAGELSDALGDDGARVELETAEMLFTKTVSLTKEVRDGILAATRADGYDPRTDEFLFRKALFRVRERAKAEGATSIDTVLYFRVLLESPTAILKKQLLLDGENYT